jgi:hypothetical protein
LEAAFAALIDSTIPLDLIRLWFDAQLLRLNGHTPNLQTQPDGTRLAADQTYEFSFDDSAFVARADAPYTADHIKFLRLVFAGNTPAVLTKVSGMTDLAGRVRALVVSMLQQR